MSITEIYDQTIEPLPPGERLQLAALILNQTVPSAPAPKQGGGRDAGAARRALDFYERDLRARLEPECQGQYVAIHPDTRDYRVERGPGKAFRALRAAHPDGAIILHPIGIADDGLRARLRGGRVNV